MAPLSSEASTYVIGVATGAALFCALRWFFRDGEERRLTCYDRSTCFPPRSVGGDPQKAAEWYLNVFAATPMQRHDPQLWTPHESKLLWLSAAEYIRERRAGRVTCEEYCALLVRRVRLYRYMNQWTYRSYDLLDRAIEAARAFDVAAATAGVEAIAPL